jgi:phage tail protein X
MARFYITKDGDMVDLIAFNHYGDEAGRKAIYDANPGLADVGLELIAGMEITIPEWAKPEPKTPTGGVTS